MYSYWPTARPTFDFLMEPERREQSEENQFSRGKFLCHFHTQIWDTQLSREKIINKTEKNPTSHTEQIFGTAEHALVVLLAIMIVVKIIFIFEQHETFTDINSWRRSCFEYHCYFGSCTESLSRFKIQWHIAFKELVRE